MAKVLLLGGEMHDQVIDVAELTDEVRVATPPKPTLEVDPPTADPTVRDEVTYRFAGHATAEQFDRRGFEAIYESPGYRLQLGM